MEHGAFASARSSVVTFDPHVSFYVTRCDLTSTGPSVRTVKASTRLGPKKAWAMRAAMDRALRSNRYYARSNRRRFARNMYASGTRIPQRPSAIGDSDYQSLRTSLGRQCARVLQNHLGRLGCVARTSREGTAALKTILRARVAHEEELRRFAELYNPRGGERRPAEEVGAVFRDVLAQKRLTLDASIERAVTGAFGRALLRSDDGVGGARDDAARHRGVRVLSRPSRQYEAAVEWFHAMPRLDMARDAALACVHARVGRAEVYARAFTKAVWTVMRRMHHLLRNDRTRHARGETTVI